MERIDARAASATVLDVEGNAHPLAALWGERTALLVFVRHFG
ncbi:MAG TPA: hypothetical protein VIW03_14725 [Anaeromyxobacter sp.]